MKIYLNEILRLEDLENVKIRFNLMFEGNWNPIEIFKNGDVEVLNKGQYHNNNKRSYKIGQVTVGLIKIRPDDDLWLLFHVGRVTKDLNVLGGPGYEYEPLNEYSKYLGRIIVRFKNKSQTMIRYANTVIDECEVTQILPDIFDNDIFPGYDKINVSWNELSRVVSKEGWKTALQNQKGVYLIVDTSNGKMYVGSAYGEHMLLGRWLSYVLNGHGGNVELKKLPFEHIQKYFQYSILDVYKSTTDDQLIIDRENWWKTVLLTRRGEQGYNRN
jgi:hypothetical protein